ncbi:MAG: GTP-binding protein, partial [Thermoanaerobaculia bacterium]|nr:GTP-binding protein [Thermoanaerobaculia bacterium]
MEQIRNFCIIAHIDHGKSTLADRLIQRCGGVEAREFRDQLLDTMELERERGITIKSNTISLPYTARDGRSFELNLIDTPGHVDFSHEVRRSLMAAEGALLVVDASQGVEAQTVANLFLAVEYGLEVLPVINKIDLPSADVERAMEEIDRDLGLDPFASVQVSAKLGTGVDELLEAIVAHLPAPQGDPEAPLQALLFDAQYDPYRGAVLLVRVMAGRLRPGLTVRLMHSDAEHRVEEVGRLRLKRVPSDELVAGEVGYVIAGIKSLAGLAIGDTLTESARPAAGPVPGYREAKPVVFSSIYPMATDDYEELTKALEKLKLNDAALIYE